MQDLEPVHLIESRDLPHHYLTQNQRGEVFWTGAHSLARPFNHAAEARAFADKNVPMDVRVVRFRRPF